MRSKSLASWLWFSLGLVSAAAIALFVAFHWGYYSLPFAARPLDPRNASLRPAGSLGLAFGIVGSVLMLLNLLYLVRKRFRALTVLGSLRGWMGFHVLTGSIAAALILLHSAFLPRSALAILGSASLLVVIVSGVVGRFIYARVPRSVEGRELELEEIRRQLEAHRRELMTLGVDPRSSILDPRSRFTTDPTKRTGFLSTLGVLAFGDRDAREQYATARAAVLASDAPRASSRRICRLLGELGRERSWLARYAELRSLMSSWRFLHRWLAVLMLVLAAFHVAIALHFGDLWIFHVVR
ncbi:MAG: hypothetical protein HYR85_07900 [Planctomycetes bacterium]|nr:hypothetical protein [Planctomycetota bacterium]MBI3848163.1 hypothetical protein [Planctomycetota bacterium]